MSKGFPAVSGNGDIFNDNLHASVLLGIFSYTYPRFLSLFRLKTISIKIPFGRLSFSRHKKRPRTNIAPAGGYHSNIRVRRKAQLKLRRKLSQGKF